MSVSRPKSTKHVQKLPATQAAPAPASASRNSTPVKGPRPGASRPKPPPGGIRRPIPVPAHLKEMVTPVKVNKGKAKEVSSPSKPISIPSDDEDEEDDFEEVVIPQSAGPSSPFPGTPTTAGTNLTAATTPGTVTTAPSVDDNFGSRSEDEEGSEDEDDGVIHLEIGGETAEEKAKRIALALRKKPITSKDRAIRLEAHKIHVIALLAAVRIRNRWCCNALLQARLLSLLPHPLQSAFHIPPSRFPDRAQRSRLFFDALQSLATWWSQSFFDVPDSTLGMRTRPWDEVQEIVNQLPKLTRADFTPNPLIIKEKTKGKGKDKEDDDYIETLGQGAGGERLRSVNSLMKKALQQEGSRDVSAQLFVSLARACGMGVRLVCSLQAVPWRAEKVTQKKKPGAGRGGRTVASRQGNGPTSEDDDEDDDEMEEVPIPGEENGSAKKKKSNVRAAGTRRLQDPADLYRLRKVKPAPQKVGTSKPKPKTKQDLSEQPPVFWAEVFSRSDQRWIPVDPVQGTIRKKTHYEPTSDSGPVRMLYVIAFEEDGYARDVTLRYTKNFGAKTIKLRVPQKKDEPDWWDSVVRFLARPYRLNRDELEDAELEMSQVSEGMPLHMNGFKDHPIYVLERHLKREEVIQPKREIGRFRGEPVYRRSNVQSCKTAENWMRIGRKVKDRQEPMKWVKQRAVTLQKRRAQELAVQEGQEPIQQGLYAQWQTEIYIPPPIKDGVIPQNSFGNIDLYAPTMLPAGAVHLPYKGIAKVAKALGISYAEACTGFEFKKQRAIPVITGIVVATENETLTMDAYMESTAAAEERARIKAEEKALKRWVKLINGLRVRKRLQAEYGQGEELHENQLNPLADPASVTTEANTTSAPKKSAASVIASAHQQNSTAWVDKHRDRSLSLSVGSHTGEEGEAPPESKNDNHADTAAAQSGPEGEVQPMEMSDEVAVEEGKPEIGESSLSDIDMEAIQPRAKITLRVNGETRPSSLAEKPLESGRPSRSRNGKRKEPELIELAEESEEVEEPRAKRSRARKPSTKAIPRVGKAKVQGPSNEGVTRSLRSRAPKNEEQERLEAEKRERIQRALRGDDGDEDEE